MDNSNYLAPTYSSRSFTAFDQRFHHGNDASKTHVSYSSGSAQKKTTQQQQRFVNSASGTPRAGHWYPSSSVGTPDVINRIEVKNSASSVVLAFRELQEKSKQIEFERITASNEVDDLKRRLAEARRNESLQRSRSEIRTTDEVLMIRESCERLLEETGELQARLSKASELMQNESRDVAFHKSRISELNEATSRNHVEIQALEYRVSQLQEDILLSKGRAEDIDQKLLSVKSSHSIQITRDHRLSQLHTKINREKASSMRTTARITALQKYLEIILKVNGDLTEALKNKEVSSSRIFRIVESHTKHMASRDSVHTQSTSNLMRVPNSPRRKLQSYSADEERDKKSSSRKKKKKDIKSRSSASVARKSVLDMDDDEMEGLVTSKKSKNVASGSTKTAIKLVNATKKQKSGKVTEKNKVGSVKKRIVSVLDTLDKRDECWPQDKPSRLYTDSDYEASLLSRIAELTKEREQYANAFKRIESVSSSNTEEYVDKKHRTRIASSLLSDTASSRSRATTNRTDSAVRCSIDSVGSNASKRSSGSPGRLVSGSDSSRSDWLLKPNLNPRHHDRAMFDATGGANCEDRRFNMMRSASAEPSRGRNARADKIAAPRRVRSLSNGSRRHVSGLILTAGRLAATAAASAHAAAANVQSAGRVGRIFVPSSPADSKEFNVMASVSKAARSAREMNATLASRVMSLDFDGCGPQFSEIAKIDLSDMHDYLTVVKKLRDTNASR